MPLTPRRAMRSIIFATGLALAHAFAAGPACASPTPPAWTTGQLVCGAWHFVPEGLVPLDGRSLHPREHRGLAALLEVESPLPRDGVALPDARALLAVPNDLPLACGLVAEGRHPRAPMDQPARSVRQGVALPPGPLTGQIVCGLWPVLPHGLVALRGERLPLRDHEELYSLVGGPLAGEPAAWETPNLEPVLRTGERHGLRCGVVSHGKYPVRPIR